MRACALGKNFQLWLEHSLKVNSLFFGFSKLGEKAMTTEKNNDLN